MKNQGLVHGTVQPAFESVRQLFETNMRQLAEQNAQLCVYVDNEPVVDLWYTAAPDDDFDGDSLVNVFSSGKSLEAIALASLVSKGLLSYEERIASYWPAFAAQGKDQLTVADLMRHEAGLAAFNVSISPGDLLPEAIKANRIGAIIEQHPQKYRNETFGKREYHALTRGWIVNELFRRVDPLGRTIGEFLNEDIRDPLGADAIIGVSDHELHRVHPITPLGFGYHLKESMKPALMGRQVRDNFFSLSNKLFRMAPMARGRSRKGTPPPFDQMQGIGDFDRRDIVQGETPSANTHASARGLARIAAAMAAGGTCKQQELINTRGWDALHANPVTSSMGFNTTFTQGGVAMFPKTGMASNVLDRSLNHGRHGFYGWMGLGGSVFQWHPGLKIGFGFVPTSLHVLDIFNERGKSYQAELLKTLVL